MGHCFGYGVLRWLRHAIYEFSGLELVRYEFSGLRQVVYRFPGLELVIGRFHSSELVIVGVAVGDDLQAGNILGSESGEGCG